MNLEEKAAPDDATPPQQTTVLPTTQTRASRYPDQRFRLKLFAIVLRSGLGVAIRGKESRPFDDGSSHTSHPEDLDMSQHRFSTPDLTAF